MALAEAGADLVINYVSDYEAAIENVDKIKTLGRRRRDKAMLKERLKEIIIGILEISEDEFGEDADFFYELGADSMIGLEIVAAVEQEFGIEVEDEEVESLRNYSKLIELIYNKKGVGVC